MGSWRSWWGWTQRRQPRQCQTLQSIVGALNAKPKFVDAVTAIITENLQFKGYRPFTDAGSNTGIITENV